MSEILKIVLSLSLSGSLLILALLLCKPLFKNTISKRWQYYVWLVVVARLLVPFTPETSLVGALFQDADIGIVQMESLADPKQGEIAGAPQPGKDTTAGGNFAPQDGEPFKAAATIPQAVFGYILQNLWLVWVVGSLILLIRKMTIYQGFARYIKAGRAEVSNTAILDRLAMIGEQAGVKTPVELYTNSLISSPLLLGFFHPCIVLPTADLPDADFEYIILHELTHYKRRDMFYKWLVQVTICLHWFNPLAYLMGREISRACELACDEAVICKLDAKRQRDYGDTLLNAIAIGGDYRDSLASMTLNESKVLLKERLAAIMKFKNQSKVVRISTALLTVTCIFGAIFTGAYAAIPGQTALPENKKTEQVPAVSFNDIPKQAEEKNNKTTTQNENWSFFNYIYLDGYMLGIGSRAQDNLQNYSQTIQIAVNDKEYPIAFYEQEKLYAKDDKFIKVLRVAIADILSQGWLADSSKGSFLIVNQVIAGKTADDLCGDFYEKNEPIALPALIPYVKKETIEKYIAKAYEDNNEAMMMFILMELPNDFAFNADTLARRALADGRQMMCLHLSRFVSPAVRRELDEKLFGLAGVIPPLPPVPSINESTVKGGSANGMEADNRYAEYEKFGLTYNADNERFYYEGKLVRYFEDIYRGDFAPNKRMTIAGYKDGEIDVHTVSDKNGVVTGVAVYDQAGFNENTQKLEDPLAQFGGSLTNTNKVDAG